MCCTTILFLFSFFYSPCNLLSFPTVTFFIFELNIYEIIIYGDTNMYYLISLFIFFLFLLLLIILSLLSVIYYHPLFLSFCL